MYCGKCGKQINSSFCPYCGAKNDNFNSVNNNINNNNVSTPSLAPKKKISVGFLYGILLVLSIAFLSIGFVSYRNNRSRTVMIYMVGADLESDDGLASTELDSIDFNKIDSNKVKVILMAGGSKKWHNNYIDVSETSIYELQESGFVKVDKRPRKNMGTSDNLNYFLKYVYNNYKANKYDFIFWNHGGAVDGSEYDELAGDDRIDLGEMYKAFDNSNFKGLNKLEILGFRTCLNGTVEVANVYKKFAKYLVASEESTRGNTVVSPLEFINDIKPHDDADDVGIKMIEGYKKFVTTTCNYVQKSDKEENYCIDSTYSLVDLSKIDELNVEFDKFSEDLNNNISSKYNEMIKIRANMSQYASDQPARDMVDLYDFVEKFQNYSSSSESLKKAINKAVVYNWSTNDYSHGLSVYYPYNENIYLDFYPYISVSKNYSTFVNKFYNNKEGVKTKSFSNIFSKEVKVDKVTKDDADIEVELSEEQIDNISKARYYVFSEGENGYYNLAFIGKDYRIDGNRLKANVNGKTIKICDSDYDDLCTKVYTFESESTDKYTDIRVPAYVRSRNDKVLEVIYMEIRLENDKDEGEIRGVYKLGVEEKDEEEQKSLAAKTPVGIFLDDYDFLEIEYYGFKLFKDNGQVNPYWSYYEDYLNNRGSKFRTDKFKVVKEDFNTDLNYYVIFEISDLANEVYYTNPVKIK